MLGKEGASSSVMYHSNAAESTGATSHVDFRNRSPPSHATLPARHRVAGARDGKGPRSTTEERAIKPRTDPRREAWPTPHADVNALLRALQHEVTRILGLALVGTYLSGSLLGEGAYHRNLCATL